MSHIAVDLKVIEVLAPMVARSASISEDRALAGLVRLWHRCWSTTSDVVTLQQLAGVFGGERIAEVADVLCADFLERTADGFRVRGADRYLRLKASRRSGALKTNKLRNERRSRATLSDAQATLPNALTPNTEHRTPNTEKKSTAPAAPTPRESDLLCQDFFEAVGAAYVWQGAKDGVALADLRKAADLEEVRARWRKGLRATGWLQVRTVAQLRAKWNDLAGDAKAPASLKAPIPAESVDWGGVQSGEVLL